MFPKEQLWWGDAARYLSQPREQPFCLQYVLYINFFLYTHSLAQIVHLP